ncbi:hypothetical protein B0H63DRAFT_532490 [Podospora didyma]|uniref:Spc7 kinetochore protein domain-containing protein n=1 Tax=Podospora didyma TaxID=330526 RepID=A0AAE0P7E4_9PEZI|nr:hypothetical protein B0H63DRAFT_532490 [Podospora didyma]
MSSQAEATLPATRRTRKSIGGRSPSSRKTGDKENATIDLGSTMAASRKKSRSKSMGPGGLDILKSGAGNRRVSLAVPSIPPPRSILKPTMPLLPDIPPHRPNQFRANSSETLSKAFNGNENGSGSGTKVALRTEEEQHAAAREREERERAVMEKEVNDRREARRKSLANRRVSFAAEATLHTFSVEYIQDSTTSTDSTRRASSVAAPSPAPREQEQQSSDASEPPSTPPEHVDEPVSESPANQRDLHQKRHRRSSGAATLDLDNVDDDTMYDSDLEHADSVTEIQGEEMTDSSDDSEEDGTMMTVEQEEMTSASLATARSGFSPDSSGSLDENLRLAARMATTQRMDDEDEEEVIAGFAGWGRKNPSPAEITQEIKETKVPSPAFSSPRDDDQGSEMEMDMDIDMDMDITKAVGGILRQKEAPPTVDQGEDMDMEMEMDMDLSMDVTRALGGIISKPKPQNRRKSIRTRSQPQPPEDVTSYGDQTMEFTTAVGGIQHGRISDGSLFDTDDNEDMSMELTTAIGGFVPGSLSKIGAPKRRRTIAAENKTPPAKTGIEDGDETMGMDMTMAVGGIIKSALVPQVQSTAMKVNETTNFQRAMPPPDEEDGDQTMGMDMTMAVGGIIQAAPAPQVQPVPKKASATSSAERIPPPLPDQEDGDETMGMDMTLAVGGIMKSAPTPEARSAAKKIMEQEADGPDPSITASVEIQPSPKRRVSAITDENGSPQRAAPPQGRGLRRSPVRERSPVMRSSPNPPSSPLKSSPIKSSPVKTPSIQSSPVRSSPIRTPSPKRNVAPGTPTPMKTPPAIIGSRSNSPKRQMSGKDNNTPRSPSKSLFRQDPSTGLNTPRVVLTPQGRRLSGIGIDRSGLGSPRVAEIFDCRGSLGDAAIRFSPAQVSNTRRAVTFTDPRAMEAEIDRERQAEEEKENSRRILQRDADGPQDEPEVTLNLREMIQGLSPKKPILRGRKSLHVGSARGILGKRPAELDDDEDIDQTDGVKRLKGHQGSPVKNVRLRSPPSKAETTTGRKTRASPGGGLGHANANTITPSNAGSSPQRATTPKSQGRFKHVDDQPTYTMDFTHTAVLPDLQVADEDDERIHLQDFLNMTSIRFMELNTTKRRHTVAPSAPRDSTASSDGKEDISLEKCVVAGACTVPMLELYQHSCRELKKYISEGRRIVREIETETFVENPPLFREYISATPEFKVLMDNQFKNVKSHARLLSKAMWYEWRMKLQDGLKEGLLKISEGMDSDDRLLEKQQKLLSSVLPDIIKRSEAIEREHEDLAAAARELADCDPRELEAARADLVSVDKDIAEKAKRIAELRSQLQESEKGIETMTKQKQECLDDIKEAEKTREEFRAQTDALERQHGWAITGISGSTISMSYEREIKLVFDIASIQEDSPKKDTRIDLWYIADKRERNPLPATLEKEFFLQCIRDHVRGGAKPAPSRVSRLLGTVSAAWDKANVVADHVRQLNLTFPTTVVKTSDTSISIRSSLLLVPLQTRAEVVLSLHSLQGGEGVEVSVVPDAKVVYGEQFSVPKMTEFLGGKITGSTLGNAAEKQLSWSEVVVELHRRLLAKGLKARQK